jgi:hypothetical protein
MSAEEKFAERQQLAVTALNRLPLTFRLRAVMATFIGTDLDYLAETVNDAAATARRAAVKPSPARYNPNPTPRLAEGHTLPTRPVHWAIQIRDADTGKLLGTRGAWDKTKSPQAASHQAFGMGATANMTFFNLGTTLAGARKMLRTLPE